MELVAYENIKIQFLWELRKTRFCEGGHKYTCSCPALIPEWPLGEFPLTVLFNLSSQGVTYDTGGADIKAGGHMAGMSRYRYSWLHLSICTCEKKHVLIGCKHDMFCCKTLKVWSRQLLST